MAAPCQTVRMPYKPEQLPFEEFEEVVRALKRKLDDNAPHYPLVAQAFDWHGQEIMHQHFAGPFKRPAAQVTNNLKEWDVPVIIVMKDSSGLDTRTNVPKVTVKNPEPNREIQLCLSDTGVMDDE
jgi:hypothetical protein